jgi:hypothetical protein
MNAGNGEFWRTSDQSHWFWTGEKVRAFSGSTRLADLLSTLQFLRADCVN